MRKTTLRVVLFISLPVVLGSGFAPAQGVRDLTLDDTCYRVMFGVRMEPPRWVGTGHVVLGPGQWFNVASGKSERMPRNIEPEQPKLAIEGGEVVLGGRKLTSDGGAKREAHLSPDGKRASYVKDHNLYVVDIATKKSFAASLDGKELLLYGYLDWVYQEEVYGRGDFQANWWSPDSEKLAFLRLDESKVRQFTRVGHTPKGQKAVAAHESVLKDYYPKVGDPNPTVKLGVAHVKTEKVVWVDLSGYDADVLVVRVSWTPDNRVIFQVQDRIQTWLDLVVADPATGATTKLFRETSKTWVNILGQPKWLADGKTFLWLSERTGFKHIYKCVAGKDPVAVTAGDWQVREIKEVDAKAQSVWFTGTKDGVVNDNLYSAELSGDDAANPTRLTEGAGMHEVVMNPDGSMFLDIWSTLSQPPQLRVCSGAEAKVIRKVSAVRPPVMRVFRYEPAELLQVKARDGYMLDVTLKVPIGKGPRPVFVASYFGPDGPSVSNSWPNGADPTATWHEFLRQQGVLVVQLNVRTASGRGQVDTGLCYKNFGAVELRDIEDVIDYVCAKRGGDKARVGIAGWSYGGYMSAYALTHSTKFELGIAGGGCTTGGSTTRSTPSAT